MKIPYQLIRSNRRTLSLMINEQGALVVHAPKQMLVRDITQFIELKQHWIYEKQALRKARQSELLSLDPISCAALPYLGQSLPIRYAALPFVIRYHDTLLVPNQGDPKAHIRAWQKAQAPLVLIPRVDSQASRMGLRATQIAFTTAKKRWGSMKSDGSLRLNAALIHCPTELIDYVIVHELAHLAHPNHSPAFHAYVRSILPNEQALQNALKSLSYLTTMLDAKEIDAH